MKEKLSIIIQNIQNLSTRSKIIILTVSVLFILLIVTIAVLLSSGQSDNTMEEIDTQIPQTEALYGSIKFASDRLPIQEGQIQSVPIILDLGTNSAYRVTFTVNFDPESINTVELSQELDNTSPLSHSFITEDVAVSATDGYARIVLLLKEGASEQMGSGEIAQFSFRANPEYQGKLGITIADPIIESLTMGTSYVPQTNTLLLSQ